MTDDAKLLLQRTRQLVNTLMRQEALIPRSDGGLAFDVRQTGYAPRRLGTLTGNTSSSGTTETTLFTVTVAAGTVSGNGIVEMDVGGSFVAHATATRRVRVKIGSTTVLDTGDLTTASGDYWRLNVRFLRLTDGSCMSNASFTSSGSVVANSQLVAGNVWGSAATVALTGQAGGVGAATGDVVAIVGTVEYKP